MVAANIDPQSFPSYLVAQMHQEMNDRVKEARVMLNKCVQDDGTAVTRRMVVEAMIDCGRREGAKEIYPPDFVDYIKMPRPRPM